MQIKFSGMTADDYKNNCSRIQLCSNMDAFRILSFDSMDVDDANFLRSNKSAHLRGRLDLTCPVINKVLCGPNYIYLSNIFGKCLGPNTRWEYICKFQLVYDTDANVLVAPHEIHDGGHYLYGAEIIKKCIDELDINKELTAVVKHAFRELKMSKYGFDGVASTGTEQYKITDGFYLVPVAPLAPEHIKVSVNAMREFLFNNSTSSFTLLYNNREHKENLYCLLLTQLSVPTEDLRPEFKEMAHKLTARYSRVILADRKLKSVLSTGHNSQTAYAAYKDLQTEVNNLLHSNNTRDRKSDDIAILERVKSKNGQIRKNNLGKRQDYSGRAVVSINPFLPIDTIRIPKRMLPRLYEYHALKYIKEHKEDYVPTRGKSSGETSAVYKNFSNLKAPEVQDYLLDVILKNKIYEQVPIYMGRQPTLHKQSLQGFHIEPSDYASIEVNPLVCPAYNMDFDGDQAHLQVPLGTAAVEEVRDLLLTTHNLFLAKTGELTTTPRQDMLYGLYICTRKAEATNKPTSAFKTELALREAVVNHTINVHDTVMVRGRTMQAGQAAVLTCFNPAYMDPVVLEGKPDKALKEYIQNHGKLAITEFNKKTINIYMDFLADWYINSNSFSEGMHIGVCSYDNTTLTGIINLLVELGFKVARIYTPTMSLLSSSLEMSDTSDLVRTCTDVIFKDRNITSLAEASITDREDIENWIQYLQLAIHNPANSNNLVDILLDTFNSCMSSIDMYYDLGLENKTAYTKAFNKFKNWLDACTKELILDALDENGFSLLAKSGARGNADNVKQIFAYLGQIKKNDTETFDALIPHSLSSQLSPMEHFIHAYGGRSGQMDKSLKTGDTGYASREMWHLSQELAINVEDCGTREGIKYYKTDMLKYTSNTVSQMKEASETFEHVINGRYLQAVIRKGNQIDTSYRNKLISKYNSAEAIPISDITDNPDITGVILRSPLTCNNPCCKKCYGIDWSTRKPVNIGTNVGLIAAQSIGEPGTQLTMKQFQKGGVADANAVTSAFDKVNAYICMLNLNEKAREGSYYGYEPTAWADGPIHVEETPTCKIAYIGDDRTSKVIVPKSTEFAATAERGTGMCIVHGDLYLKELLDYAGIEATQKYLAYKLYDLYKGEVKIAFTHFEVLAASMTRYMVITSDREDLKVGQYCTRRELLRNHDIFLPDTYNSNYYRCDGTLVIPRFLSVSDSLLASHAALDKFQMENPSAGLGLNCLLRATDDLVKPINRMVISQPPLTAGARSNADFIMNRKENL